MPVIILLSKIFVSMLIEELCDGVSKYEFPLALYIKDYSVFVLQFFIAQCASAFDLVPVSLYFELKLGM